MTLLAVLARHHRRATLTLSGTFANAIIGTPYSSDLTITGGDGSYSNPRVTVGTRPTWAALSIVGSPGAYKLRLSGTPTGSATTVNITVAVDSGDGQTATSAQSFGVVTSNVTLFVAMQGANGSTSFPDTGPSAFVLSHSGVAIVNPAPFGGSAAYFAGAGYISCSDFATISDFGTGDFSISVEVCPDNVSSEQVLCGSVSSWASIVAYLLEFRAGGDLRFYAGDGVPLQIFGGAGSISAGVLQTIKVERISGVTKLYNGATLVGSHTGTVNIVGRRETYIGKFVTGSSSDDFYAGYMRNLVVKKGGV